MNCSDVAKLSQIVPEVSEISLTPNILDSRSPSLPTLLTQCSARRSLPFAYVNLLCSPLSPSLPLSLSLSPILILAVLRRRPLQLKPASFSKRIPLPHSATSQRVSLPSSLKANRTVAAQPAAARQCSSPFLPVAHPFKVCRRRRRHFQLPSARYIRDDTDILYRC